MCRLWSSQPWLAIVITRSKGKWRMCSSPRLEYQSSETVSFLLYDPALGPRLLCWTVQMNVFYSSVWKISFLQQWTLNSVFKHSYLVQKHPATPFFNHLVFDGGYLWVWCSSSRAHTAYIVFMLTQPFADHVRLVNEGIFTLGEFALISTARTTWMDAILEWTVHP